MYGNVQAEVPDDHCHFVEPINKGSQWISWWMPTKAMEVRWCGLLMTNWVSNFVTNFVTSVASSGASMIVLVNGCRRAESMVMVVLTDLLRKNSPFILWVRILSLVSSTGLRLGGEVKDLPTTLVGPWTVFPPSAFSSSLHSPFGELASLVRFSGQLPLSSSSSWSSLSTETTTTLPGRLQSPFPCFWLRPFTFSLQLVSLDPTVHTNCSC